MTDERAIKVMTKQELWEKVNSVKCHCGSYFEPEGAVIDFPIRSEGDLDDAYDMVSELNADCCDDPFFTAVIKSDEPLFNHDIDNDFHLRPIAPTPFVPLGREKDEWVYEVDDNTFDILAEAGLLVDG